MVDKKFKVSDYVGLKEELINHNFLGFDLYQLTKDFTISYKILESKIVVNDIDFTIIHKEIVIDSMIRVLKEYCKLNKTKIIKSFNIGDLVLINNNETFKIQNIKKGRYVFVNHNKEKYGNKKYIKLKNIKTISLV